MYRKINSILITGIIILISACTGQRYPQSLIKADSLCHVNPDSAVSILKGIRKEMKRSPEDIRMYYRLLCIQADDKADKMEPEKEKENITAIVGYYEHDGDKKLLPIAYYYAGRVYAEMHEAPKALDYFQKAKEALKDKDNTYLRSKIYSQMGYLFHYQELYNESLKMFFNAYNYNKQKNDTIAMIYDLRDISTAYESENKHDKALQYIKNAYKLAKLYDNKYILRFL